MSVVGKPGYKETDAGWIPVDWEATNFGALLSGKPEYGANAAAAEFCGEDSVRYIRITDIDEAGRLLETGKKYLPVDEAKDYLLTENDLLIARSGNTVGKSLLFKEDMGRCAFAGYLIRFRMGKRLEPKYAAQYLHSDAYWAWVKGSSKVGAQPNINSQQYQGMPLPLPSLPEQQKIAAILSAVDDKLDVIACQIETTQTLKRGLMQTLFSRGVGTQDAQGCWQPHTEFQSDDDWGEIPAGWQITTLGSVCGGALQTGPFGSQLHAAEYQDEGVLVLMPKDLLNYRANLESAAKIAASRAVELARHTVKAGDLLFSRRGDVTRFALIDEASEGALCGTGCLKAKPTSNHSSAYLSHLLQLDTVKQWLEQNAVGQTMPNMNTGILASLPLVTPATLAEELEIAGMLDGVDAKFGILKRKQTHYQTLKRGLMQKLLTGEWRVKVDTVAA